MSSLIEAVKVVKDPVLPRDDDEEQEPEVDRLMYEAAALRARIDAAGRPVTMRTGLERFMCSPELARFIAATRI
jgi:hypothetical protein